MDPQRSPVATRDRSDLGDAAEEDAAPGDRGAPDRLIDDPTSRKRFLRMLGGGAGAAALASVAAACGAQPPVGSTQQKQGEVAAFGAGDAGIVNFALFLEYLEGDFYDRLVEEDVVSGRLRELVRQVRQNEVEHRNALERVADQIGRQIRKPESDFDAVFERGESRIIAFAGMLENLGSAAYLGQIRYIQDREILTAALRIHSVEARQAAAFNEAADRGFHGRGLLVGSLPTGAFARPMSQQQALKRLRPYIVGGLPNLRPPIA